MRGFFLLFFLALPASVAFIVVLSYAGVLPLGTQSLVYRFLVFVAENATPLQEDISLVGEVTPAGLAAIIAALAPRPIRLLYGVVIIAVCVFGYALFLDMSTGINGGSLLLADPTVSFRDWVRVGIEGSVMMESENGSSEDIGPERVNFALARLLVTFEVARIYYSIIGASVIGFLLNKSGKTEEVDGS